MRSSFKVFGAVFMVMCSVMLACSCYNDVFYADIEDSRIITMHDKDINKEYECSEFYINGLYYENTKLTIRNIDSELYCFEVKSNENSY